MQTHSLKPRSPQNALWWPLLAFLMMAVVSSQDAKAQDLIGSSTILQGLDKVTARIITIIAPHHLPVRFGTLEIEARACHKKPPEETPENAAYLHIRDLKAANTVQTVFQGWMFSSSPALSALEHPVYDIWVLDCGFESIPNQANTSSSDNFAGNTAE